MQKIKTRDTVKNVKVLDKSIARKMKNASSRIKDHTGQERQAKDEQPKEYAVNQVSDKAEGLSREAAHHMMKQGKEVIKSVKNRSIKIKTADPTVDNTPTDIPKETEQVQTGEMAKEYAKAKSKDKATIKMREKTIQGRNTEMGEIPHSPTPQMAGKDKAVSHYAEKTTPKTIRPTPKTNATTTPIKGNPKYVKHSIKTGRATVKGSAKNTKRASKAVKTSAKNTAKAAKASQRAVRATAQTVKTTVKATIKATVTTIKAAVAAVKTGYALIAAGGWVVILIVLIVVLFAGILSLNTSNNSTSLTPVSEEVKAYEPLITQYATKHGVPGYVELIKAVMMQESGGKGKDPMQASECSFNTKYPRTPNGITKAEYSIDVGIQNLAACLKAAEAKNPIDMDNIKTALQGYNYGNGYIAWAIENYGGYTAANAVEFSENMKKKLGWDSYGDTGYVPHVLQYYPIGDVPMGTGNQAIVQIALTQEGNKGGKLYWSWYGFSSRVSWCACFVSWCADQCGLIESGTIPKFSLCSDGADWFKQKGLWQGKGYAPSPGDIIFFDRDKSGTTHHVGIVESMSEGTVNTIEGNSGDVCKRRSYSLDDETILGYGVPIYG